MRIGVLAVQGAFAEHINVLKKLGVEAFEIRNTGDLSAPSEDAALEALDRVTEKWEDNYPNAMKS